MTKKALALEQSATCLLTILRSTETPIQAFRNTADTLSRLLALEALNHIPMRAMPISTPLAQSTGLAVTQRIILIPILRSGITMVDPFISVLPQARIGVVGLRRDERTAQAHWYYENIPPLQPDDQLIILDPMIATGGTGTALLTKLHDMGAPIHHALYVSMISAKHGIQAIKKTCPGITIICAGHDQDLSPEKFIIPGLGDFGDRYFGTE